MAEAQLALVKDYFGKYNLEAEVSYAVNLAIKVQSDDPFRVICDYLKTLQNVRARSLSAALRGLAFRARFSPAPSVTSDRKLSPLSLIHI